MKTILVLAIALALLSIALPASAQGDWLPRADLFSPVEAGPDKGEISAVTDVWMPGLGAVGRPASLQGGSMPYSISGYLWATSLKGQSDWVKPSNTPYELGNNGLAPMMPMGTSRGRYHLNDAYWEEPGPNPHDFASFMKDPAKHQGENRNGYVAVGANSAILSFNIQGALDQGPAFSGTYRLKIYSRSLDPAETLSVPRKYTAPGEMAASFRIVNPDGSIVPTPLPVKIQVFGKPEYGYLNGKTTNGIITFEGCSGGQMYSVVGPAGWIANINTKMFSPRTYTIVREESGTRYRLQEGFFDGPSSDPNPSPTPTATPTPVPSVPSGPVTESLQAEDGAKSGEAYGPYTTYAIYEGSGWISTLPGAAVAWTGVVVGAGGASVTARVTCNGSASGRILVDGVPQPWFISQVGSGGFALVDLSINIPAGTHIIQWEHTGGSGVFFDALHLAPGTDPEPTPSPSPTSTPSPSPGATPTSEPTPPAGPAPNQPDTCANEAPVLEWGSDYAAWPGKFFAHLGAWCEWAFVPPKCSTDLVINAKNRFLAWPPLHFIEDLTAIARDPLNQCNRYHPPDNSDEGRIRIYFLSPTSYRDGCSAAVEGFWFNNPDSGGIAEGPGGMARLPDIMPRYMDLTHIRFIVDWFRNFMGFSAVCTCIWTSYRVAVSIFKIDPDLFKTSN